MSTNPFENNDHTYFVLVNDEGQHSLWPAFATIPDDWQAVFGEQSRQSCLDYVEEHWVDMRPTSLIKAMDRAAS